jgi:hypothetical protein
MPKVCFGIVLATIRYDHVLSKKSSKVLVDLDFDVTGGVDLKRLSARMQGA